MVEVDSLAREVVVLGAGMAGLTASIAAAESGARVTLVERAPDIGGSMAISGGGIWAPRDEETALQYVPKGDPDLLRLLVRELDSLWHWYVDHGLALAPERPNMKNDIGRLRMVVDGSPGRRYPFATELAKVAQGLGVVVHTATDITSLERLGPKWTMTGRTSRTAVRLEADAVVFATGGFQNNLELLERYVSPEARHLLVRSNRTSDGAALRLLEPHGAALTDDMSSFYGHSMPYIADGEVPPQSYLPASQYYSDYAVLLNRYGLRFVDESVGVVDEYNAQQGARQPLARYWIVLDSRIRAEHGSEGLAGITDSLPGDRLAIAADLGGRVITAPTLDELSEELARLGLPLDQVRASLDSYNHAVDPSLDLNPPRTRNYAPLETSPFYAVECVAAITYTMGGVRVDTDCRVQRPGHGILNGAYAAGADAGGVFRETYAGGLAWAGVSGRIAGRNAAQAHF